MKTVFVTAISLAFSFNIFCQFNFLTDGPDNKNLSLYSDLKTGSKNLLTEDFKNHRFLKDKLELTVNDNYPESAFDTGNLKHNISGQTKKKKSVALGTILSAIIPGAGEFYGESYLKAGIFFGIELLAWGTFTYFTIKGDDKTEEYQNYADAHWNIRRYAQWLVDEWNATGVNPQEPDLEVLRGQVNAYESNQFSHTLPEFGSQQYYELIGKYQPYVSGWEDAYINGTWQITQQNYQTYQTAMFRGYAVDRQDANDQYDIAKIGPITAILNHILSAADAAWTISTYNKNIKVETGFRMDSFRSPYTYELEMMPMFNMKVSF